MRIIAGTHKGRKFTPPAKNWPTRPTTDFAKEGLFNILQNNLDFEQTKVLDLFGGTGSHSYEFASRGSRDITYVDKFPAAARFVKKTATEFGFQDEIRVVQMDVFRFIQSTGERFDYIFAGPPYPLPNLDTIPDRIFEAGLLQPGGWLVLEHNPHHDFESHPHFLQVRNYGKTLFSFFEAPKEDP